MHLPPIGIADGESVTVTVERPDWDLSEMITIHSDGRITFTDGRARHGEIRPAQTIKEEDK